MISDIFSYVPEQLTVGQTCKRFYEISCNLKYFKMRFTQSQFKISDKLTRRHNELFPRCEVFSSIINSRRRIDLIDINSGFFDSQEMNDFHMKNFIKVLNRFGKDVKHFAFSGFEVPTNLIELMNLMPTLEKVSLCDMIEKVELAEKEKVELKLPNLKELEMKKCPESLLSVFDSLSPGVLRKIKVTFVVASWSSPNETFKNQENVKEVEADARIISFMSFGSKKLTSLVIRHQVKLSGVLDGQDELKVFKANYGIFPDDIKTISNELKSLEFLEFCADEIPSTNFQEFTKLFKLKKVKVIWYRDGSVNKSLSLIKNSSLVELEVTCNSTELLPTTLNQLGVNCPQLEKLQIHSKSPLKVIDSILANFSNLKSLEFICFGPDAYYQFVDGLEHNNLQSLTVNSSTTDCHDFLKLIEKCKNLQELNISLPLESQSICAVLKTHEKLKSLIFQVKHQKNSPRDRKITLEVVKALKSFGESLNHFHGYFTGMDEGISEKSLKEELKGRFSVIELKKKSLMSVQLLLMTNDK